ncbi:Ff.00g119190.m01.CDS01 [Fusarium sp. VM40]|nr:Ff.00g119190.m01.CDS01 [Fusarium sp. VM40]
MATTITLPAVTGEMRMRLENLEPIGEARGLITGPEGQDNGSQSTGTRQAGGRKGCKGHESSQSHFRDPAEERRDQRRDF